MKRNQRRCCSIRWRRLELCEHLDRTIIGAAALSSILFFFLYLCCCLILYLLLSYSGCHKRRTISTQSLSSAKVERLSCVSSIFLNFFCRLLFFLLHSHVVVCINAGGRQRTPGPGSSLSRGIEERRGKRDGGMLCTQNARGQNSKSFLYIFICNLTPSLFLSLSSLSVRL